MLKKEIKGFHLRSLNACAIGTISALSLLLLIHTLIGNDIQPYETRFIFIAGIAIALTRSYYIKVVVAPTILSGEIYFKFFG